MIHFCPQQLCLSYSLVCMDYELGTFLGIQKCEIIGYLNSISYYHIL